MYQPPYGYDITEDGNLIPIEEDLELLQEVKEMRDIQAISLRDAALYLTSKGSRAISHQGVKNRLQRPVNLEEELDESVQGC